eukprot:2414405-Rhodomonas_salina.1
MSERRAFRVGRVGSYRAADGHNRPCWAIKASRAWSAPFLSSVRGEVPAPGQLAEIPGLTLPAYCGQLLGSAVVPRRTRRRLRRTQWTLGLSHVTVRASHVLAIASAAPSAYVAAVHSFGADRALRNVGQSPMWAKGAPRATAVLQILQACGAEVAQWAHEIHAFTDANAFCRGRVLGHQQVWRHRTCDPGVNVLVGRHSCDNNKSIATRRNASLEGCQRPHPGLIHLGPVAFSSWAELDDKGFIARRAQIRESKN